MSLLDRRAQPNSFLDQIASLEERLMRLERYPLRDDLVPDDDDESDLGSSAGRWRDLHLSRYVKADEYFGVIGNYLALPALRGLWVGSVDASGGWVDLSGHGLDLTLNGTPRHGGDGPAPYWEYNGTTDYHEHSDDGLLDVIGTETYIVTGGQGLTLGGWFYFDSAAGSQECCITKGEGAGANTSYWLDRMVAGGGRFVVGDGAALQGPTASTAITQNTWTSLIGRFSVSDSEVSLFQNGTQYVDGTGVPASLLNTSAPLNIGSYNSGVGLFLDGKVALCFICAAALSDAVVKALYQQSRRLFSV